MIVLDVVDAAAREAGGKLPRAGPELSPCGFSAEQVSARLPAPARVAQAGKAEIGPAVALTTSSGNSASCRTTSSCSEVLPNSMLMSWPASSPTVARLKRDAHRVAAGRQLADVLDLPTISSRICRSSIAESGISTLCSTAIACARASMARASERT